LFRRHAKPSRNVLVTKTVVNADPAVRANLVSALAGDGAPVGVRSCTERDDRVTVAFDDAVTPAELIDDLITIESHFAVTESSDVPMSDEQAAQLASVGLGDPELDVNRILERHLAGLE
jgi:hypothetical protein